MIASAAAVGFTSNVSATTTNTGSVVTTTNNAEDDDVLQLIWATNSQSNLNTQLGGTLNSVPPNSNYLFVNLGNLTLDESDITSGSTNNETNNLGSLRFTFNFQVEGESKLITMDGALTANASTNNAFVTFVPHPGVQMAYSNGALVEFVIYDGTDVFTYPYDADNQIQLGANDTDPVYLKIGLLNDPRITQTAVPEPGSMALLGSGLVGLGVLARRRRK